MYAWTLAWQEFAERLIWFGAVYYSPVVPDLRSSRTGALPAALLDCAAAQESIQQSDAHRQLGLQRWGKGVRIHSWGHSSRRGIAAYSLLWLAVGGGGASRHLNAIPT
jgi:hypothetical protein